MYYIYIISCERGTLYTGIASDISRRMKEHFTQSEKCAKFTRSHKPSGLEGLWTAPDKSTALRLEWRIKQMKKTQKLQLIAFPDMAEKLFEEPTGIKPVREFSLVELLGNHDKQSK
ncbi:MAG: GIY-YIG nuclease family protein [Ruminococcus sp.]|nr:GIY-YIG nuclease family protein [Ruminococcus sp.]